MTRVMAAAMAGHNPADSVCLGVVAGAHGVRGLVRLRSYTERPEDIAAYGPLQDAEGARVFALTLTGRTSRHLIARIDGVTDRDAAQALAGQPLHVARDRLPEPEEEDTFYCADLVGLDVYTPGGARWGAVTAVDNYGAGDILVITAETGETLLPFTRETVTEVDLSAGRLVADPPVYDTEDSR